MSDNLNPNIITSELAGLMTSAAGRLKEFKLQWLTPQLLLHTFLEDPKCEAMQILRLLQKDLKINLDDLARRVESMANLSKGQNGKFYFTDDFGKEIPLSNEMLVVLDEAVTLARSRDEMKASSGHTLAIMSQNPQITTYGVMQKVGINGQAIIDHLDEVGQENAPILRDFVEEAKQANLRTYFERTELLHSLAGLLMLANNPHVILVGAEGVGRRTLVYSLAQQLAEGTMLPERRSVVQIQDAALLEDPLAAIRAGMRRASGGILLVPNIEQFFVREKAKYPEGANREIHKALLSNEIIIIGTTTPGMYDALRQNDLIRQHTNRLDVPAPSTKEAIGMMKTHQQRFEQEYDVQIRLEALETAVTLANQYIKTISLPASAIQVLNRAAALVKYVTDNPAVAYNNMTADGAVDADDILATIAEMTKIPVNQLTEDEKDKYANMVEHLHKRIIGQHEAVLAISRAVKTARVGLRDKKRPIGSFLFLGPSGVGKTELAKALAEFMFGTEDAMLVLDMSEFQEEASVNKLIGAPPGYVGFQGGGQLTNFVRERPYTVVLFDEVEKANDRVFDVLLQVLEEGRLTDSHGQVATFNEAVIIMTSNLGARHMLVPVIGEIEKELVMEEVHSFFRPEFLNRLDEVILFHQLSGEELAKILDLILRKEISLADEQGIELELTDAAKQWLLDQNDQPQYGARPLRRIIARHLREPLADFLLAQGQQTATKLIIDAGKEGLQFAWQN